EVQRREKLENGMVELNDPAVKSMSAKSDLLLMDLYSQPTGNPSKPRDSYIELLVDSKVVGANGKVIGYVEEAITLDDLVLQNLRNRLNAEIFFFQPDKPVIVSTHEDLALYKTETFMAHLKDDGFFELNIRGTPY